MIRELLDPSNVKKAAQTLLDFFDAERSGVKTGRSETIEAANDVQATPQDLDAAEDVVRHWQQREVDDLEGHDPDKPPIWVARDPIASLIQSLFEQYFIDHQQAYSDRRPGFAGGEHAITDLALTDEGLELLDSELRRKHFLVWPKYGERDLRFLSWGAVAKIATYLRRGPHAWPDRDGPVVPMADDSRLILVGDWGSGVPRAEKVATAMRLFVEESAKRHQECHVIHLGDVYYCGWRREYERRFLGDALWPVRKVLKDRVGSWCLNANHEMYSGGYDYFGYLLQEERFARQQGCSHFALENSHWQIVGLDTAYSEWGLHGEQLPWLARLRKSAPKKAGMLLSHHQPFCAYSRTDPNLLATLRPVIDEDLIRAWFFGHEHKCVIYKPHQGIEYPRLVGHGGVPVYAYSNGATPPGVAHELTDVMRDAKSGWEFARFGFSVMDFQADGTIEARYITENGTTHYEETLRKS
jgi:hypothetical protein